MDLKKRVATAMALGALGIWSPSRAEADEANKLTYLTSASLWRCPDTCCPPAWYTFRLADVSSDHSIVQVFNQTGTQLIATLMYDGRPSPHADRRSL